MNKSEDSFRDLYQLRMLRPRIERYLKPTNYFEQSSLPSIEKNKRKVLTDRAKILLMSEGKKTKFV